MVTVTSATVQNAAALAAEFPEIVLEVTVTSPTAKCRRPPVASRRVSRDRAGGDRHVATVRNAAAAAARRVSRDRAGGDRHVATRRKCRRRPGVAEFPEIVLEVTVTSPLA